MDNLEQRFATIRQEINRLKAALQATTDDVERHSLHASINACIRESIQLIDQHLGRHTAAAQMSSEGAPTDWEAHERSVGDERW